MTSAELEAIGGIQCPKWEFDSDQARQHGIGWYVRATYFGGTETWWFPSLEAAAQGRDAMEEWRGVEWTNVFRCDAEPRATVPGYVSPTLLRWFAGL